MCLIRFEQQCLSGHGTALVESTIRFSARDEGHPELRGPDMSKKESPKKPIWLPDWQDLCKYPDVNGKKISGRAWAWESLRRTRNISSCGRSARGCLPGHVTMAIRRVLI